MSVVIKLWLLQFFGLKTSHHFLTLVTMYHTSQDFASKTALGTKSNHFNQSQSCWRRPVWPGTPSHEKVFRIWNRLTENLVDYDDTLVSADEDFTGKAGTFGSPGEGYVDAAGIFRSG